MGALRQWARMAFLAGMALAEDCQIATVGYENGGSYLIDAKSSGQFSFASQFSNKQCQTDGAVFTVTLSGPDDENWQQYRCSDLRTSTIGQMQLSTCPIALEDIRSGQWTLDIRTANGAGTTRQFTLTVVGSSTTTVTQTPTVTVGTTTTPPPVTITSVSRVTNGVTLPIRTITSMCAVRTETTILRLPPTTSTSTTTTVSTTTGPATTRVITSYVTRTATCRIGGGPPGGVCPPLDDASFSWGTAAEIPDWIIECLASAGITWTRGKAKRTAMPLAARAAQAITETVTATNTVTRTTTATAPPQTRTQIRVDTITQTITPPPTTVCDKTANETSTLTVPGTTLTVIKIVTSISVLQPTRTSTITGTTSFVDQAASRSCVNRGGTYTWKS